MTLPRLRWDLWDYYCNKYYTANTVSNEYSEYKTNSTRARTVRCDELTVRTIQYSTVEEKKKNQVNCARARTLLLGHEGRSPTEKHTMYIGGKQCT